MGNNYDYDSRIEAAWDRVREFNELWQDCMDYYVTETYSDCTPCYVPQIPLWRRITTAIWRKLVTFAEWMRP